MLRVLPVPYDPGMDQLNLDGCTVEELWGDGSVMLTLKPFAAGDHIILEFLELEALYLAAKERREQP